MKKIVAVLAVTTILFFGLWFREITDQSEMEQLCQRYAENSIGQLLEFETTKELNGEASMANYWSAVADFYAFQDILRILRGDWEDPGYKNCAVIYNHMILAPDEVLAHMDEVLSAMEPVGKDFDSPEAWDALNELSYNLQYVWK